LDSSQRPTYWRRSFDSKDFDWSDVGWNFETKSSKVDKYTYDTTLPGYGNQGHYFGDRFSESERDDLIEYLKTL
jgi:hypothetical protein